MFVRWKTSTTKHKQYFEVTKWADQPPDRLSGDPRVWKALETAIKPRHPDYVRHAAVLVTSSRVDGVPRQKIVRWLGVISDSGLARPWPRFHFWNTITERIADLDEATRAQVIATIAKKVQPLAPEEHARMNATYQAMVASIPTP